MQLPKIDFNILRPVTNEPKPDIIRCYECAKNYDLKDAIVVEDGSWEEGYYTTHTCPKDFDHEVEYDYSYEQLGKHMKWEAEQHLKIPK